MSKLFAKLVTLSLLATMTQSSHATVTWDITPDGYTTVKVTTPGIILRSALPDDLQTATELLTNKGLTAFHQTEANAKKYAKEYIEYWKNSNQLGLMLAFMTNQPNTETGVEILPIGAFMLPATDIGTSDIICGYSKDITREQADACLAPLIEELLPAIYLKKAYITSFLGQPLTAIGMWVLKADIEKLLTYGFKLDEDKVHPTEIFDNHMLFHVTYKLVDLNFWNQSK